MPPRPAQRLTGIDPELNELLHGPESVAKQITSPFGRAEQIGHDRERAALQVGEQNGGAIGSIELALDLGRLKERVDFLGEANQLTSPFEVVHALAQVSI